MRSPGGSHEEPLPGPGTEVPVELKRWRDWYLHRFQREDDVLRRYHSRFNGCVPGGPRPVTVTAMFTLAHRFDKATASTAETAYIVVKFNEFGVIWIVWIVCASTSQPGAWEQRPVRNSPYHPATGDRRRRLVRVDDCRTTSRDRVRRHDTRLVQLWSRCRMKSIIDCKHWWHSSRRQWTSQVHDALTAREASLTEGMTTWKVGHVRARALVPTEAAPFLLVYVLRMMYLEA